MTDSSSSDNRFAARISFPVRFLCWLGAWIVLIAITMLANPAYLPMAFFFPIGWAAFLQTSDIQTVLIGITGWWMIGWCFYLVLSAALFLIRSRHLYFILFLIFCLLLTLNAIGCKRVMDAHPNLLR